MSNNMGYYIDFMDPYGKASIWLYLTLSNTFNCYEFPSIRLNSYGDLMLNDDQLFLMGQDVSTLTLFHIYKITFNTGAYNWAKQISWSSDWAPSFAESILNSDNSKIYSLFLLESNPYAYFITLNATDGSAVDSRYKSNISWSYVFGSVRDANNVVFSALWSQLWYLFVYDTSLSKLSINRWKGCLYRMTLEPSTNR